jgi:hypothetical protein
MAVDHIQALDLKETPRVKNELVQFLCASREELKVEARRTRLVMAASRDPFDDSEDEDEDEDSDYEGMDMEETDVALENYFEYIEGDAQKRVGWGLIDEMDAAMQRALDAMFPTFVEQLQNAVDLDERDAACKARWAEKEAESAARFLEQQLTVDGGRTPLDPIIDNMRYDRGIEMALVSIHETIGKRFGRDKAEVYNPSGIVANRFHLSTDRYLLETRIKGPQKEPRSMSQFGFRLGKEVTIAVERFGRRLDVMGLVNNAAIDAQRAKKDAAGSLPGAPNVSSVIFERLIEEGCMAASQKALQLMADEADAYVTSMMKVTTTGLLRYIIKTPEELPELDEADFERLIAMVVPLCAAECCDAIAFTLHDKKH